MSFCKIKICNIDFSFYICINNAIFQYKTNINVNWKFNFPQITRLWQICTTCFLSLKTSSKSRKLRKTI